jgi:sugar lactone lactonase YvrE
VVAIALAASACSSGDRYLPKFGAAETLTRTDGPVVFAVAPTGGDVYFVELRTNTLWSVGRGEERREVQNLGRKPDSLAIDQRGTIYVAARTKAHRLFITRYERTNSEVIWNGPVSRFAAHIAITPENLLIVGLNDKLFSLNPLRPPTQKPVVISGGWTDPVFTLGRGHRIWVADNAVPGQKERVARGREQSLAKRNRFASVLPAYTNPSGVALLKDELLLCSRTHKRVYRLHIGLDDVARRRDWLPGLVCDRDIALAPDGSLVTATSGAIYRYPPR